MKNMRLVLALVAVLSFGFVFQASAFPTLSEGKNRVIFTGFESGFDDSWNVVNGTVFAGVLKIKEIYNAAGTQTYESDSTTGYVSGLFMAQVVTIAPGLYTLAAFDPTLNPSVWDEVPDVFETVFGANTSKEVVKLFYTATNPGITADENGSYLSTIAGGTLWSTFGITGDSSEYMYTQITGDPFTNPDDIFGYFNFNLSGIQQGMASWGGWEGTEMIASIGLTRIVTSDGNWQVDLGDRGIIYATPEPATMVIMGAGLLGLFGLRRRQKNN